MSVSVSGCVKCGMSKKSGKYSCCARGGAWFKSCGDPSDPNFGHTWTEGIQACKGFANSISVKSPLQSRLRQAGVVVFPLNTTQPRNATVYQTKINRRGSTSSPNAGNADSENNAALASAARVYVLLIIFNLKTN